MKDITVRELMNKKVDMELKIIKAVNEIVQQFQEETGIGIKKIETVLSDLSEQELSKNKIPMYMVTNVVAILDLETPFDLLNNKQETETKHESITDYYTVKTLFSPRQLLLFD